MKKAKTTQYCTEKLSVTIETAMGSSESALFDVPSTTTTTVSYFETCGAVCGPKLAREPRT